MIVIQRASDCSCGSSFGGDKDSRDRRSRKSSQRPSEIANPDDSDTDRKGSRRGSERRFMEEEPDSADDGDMDSHPNRRPEYSGGRDGPRREDRSHQQPPRGKNFPGMDMPRRGPPPQEWR